MTQRFEDSVQATEFTEDLVAKLNDPRLADWLHATSIRLADRVSSVGEEMTNILNRVIEGDEDFDDL